MPGDIIFIFDHILYLKNIINPQKLHLDIR